MSASHANGTNGVATAHGPVFSEEQTERFLVAEPLAGYRPEIPAMSFAGNGTRPSYQEFLWDVENMLAHPRVVISLQYHKAGIQGMEVEVQTPDSKVGEFVTQEWDRFITRARKAAQYSYDFGRVGCAAKYCTENGLLRFDAVQALHPMDCTPLTRAGKYVGFRVKPGGIVANAQIDLRAAGGFRPGSPAHGLWFVHNPRFHPFWGHSQLYGAWRPWRRLAARDGAEEVTDAGVYRFAYAGPSVRFPKEDHKRSANSAPGTDPESGRQKAREIGENLKAGASIGLPSTRYPTEQGGGYLWEVEWPKHVFDVGPLLNYCSDLEKQVSLGIGVPSELFEASEVGSGYSGRAIPLEGFLLGQQDNAEALLQAWYEQVAVPLVAWNFGPGHTFQVKVKPLLQSKLKQMTPPQPAGGVSVPGGVPGAPPAPGGAPAAPAPTEPLQFATDEWARYLGPQGGKGWKNFHTGQILYQDAKPGGGTHADAPAAAPQAAKGWSQLIATEIPHARVLGPSGSGKTVFAQATAHVLPGKLYVIDPVAGPGDWGGLPVVTVAPDGSYEPIRQALRGLLEEMHRRGAQIQRGQRDFERLTILWDEVPDTVAELPEEAGLLIRRLGQRGRHANMHVIGIGQSDRVGSWGLEGYGDAASNYATVYMGDRATQAAPELAGQPFPAVLAWQGKTLPLSTQGILEKSKQPLGAGRAFKLPEAGVEMGTHAYGCVYFEMPPDLAEKIKALGAEIPAEDLAEGGIEPSPHLTLLFGLHSDDPAPLRRALQCGNGWGPVELTLGATSVFPNEDADVLKVEVYGVQPFVLNQYLAFNQAHTDTHPTYKPHVTVAYLKPGKGKKYAGDSRFDGVKVSFDAVTFAPAEGEPVRIPFAPEPLEFSTGAHAPAGYTKDKPLMIGGKAYVGGEFIPGDVLAQASPEEKAKVQGGAGGKESSGKKPDTERAAAEYKQHGTRAEAFKAWFGDWENDPDGASKVVDDDGEPKETYEVKRVYHGTTAEFNAFDKEKIGGNGSQVGKGFYFAEDKAIADTYTQGAGKVVEAFLSIKSPYAFDTMISPSRMKQWAEIAKQVAPDRFKEELFAEEIRAKQTWEKSADGTISGYSAWNALANVVGMGKVNAVLARAGYDGIMHTSRDGHGTPALPGEKGKRGRVWIAFEANQIKAVDNRGTFDSAEDDIRLATADDPAGAEPSPGLEAIVRRATQAMETLSELAKQELADALERGATVATRLAAARRVVERYKPQVARLLSDAQLAAALAGMRRVADLVPDPAAAGDAAAEAPAAAPEVVPFLSAEPAWLRLPIGDPAGPAVAAPGLTGSEPFDPAMLISVADRPPEGTEAPSFRWPMIEEAVAHLKAKRLVTPEEYAELSAQAKEDAFSVAHVEGEVALEKIRGHLVEAVAQGDTLEDFGRKVETDVGPDTFLSPAHMETVFRAATHGEYTAGMDRVLAHPMVGHLFPYAEVHAIHDPPRVRANHLAMETLGIQGTNIFRRDDPVFLKYRGPWDYGCRCGWTPLSVDEAARRGIVEAQEYLRAGTWPAEKAHVQAPPFEPSPSWRRGGDLLMSLQEEGLLLAHAPAGGVTIQGKTFPGGEFIPKGDLAKASPEEKVALRGGQTDEVSAWEQLKQFGAKVRAQAAPAVRQKIDALASKLPESVRAPVANLWHAVHAVLMTVTHSAQALALETARQKGAGEEQVERLTRTLAAADLAGHAAAYAATGTLLAIPGAQALAIPAKILSYVPVGSVAYILGSTATDYGATLKAAGKLLHEKFPEQVKGAYQFAFRAVRHPLTRAHGATATELATAEHAAGTLLDRLIQHPGDEGYLALVHAALDETHDLAQAIQMADAAHAGGGAELSTFALAGRVAGDGVALPDWELADLEALAGRVLPTGEVCLEVGPGRPEYVRLVAMLATILPTGTVQLTVGPAHPQYLKLLEAVARTRAADGDDLAFATGAHAPKGYTRQRPLVIQGKPYVGGQFIPGAVLAQATPQERAAAGVASQTPAQSAPKQTAPTQPEQPQAASIDEVTRKRAQEQYPELKKQYLDRMGLKDDGGNLTGVILNTDEWRDLFPEYTGTNASDVHEASSFCNKALLNEALPAFKGKGNGRLMVLAGGGGSGKGTAVNGFFQQQQYPLVLDQVSDNLAKLEQRLDEAKEHGYQPEYVFVDRSAEEAWGGVVGRALNLHQHGQKPRTVPLHIALPANLDARKTALELLKKRPDIPANIIDNRAGMDGFRRLITDRAEAIDYLQEQVALHDQAVAGGLAQQLHADVARRHQAGEIPDHIAKGLLEKAGGGPAPHGAGTHARGEQHYVEQAMANLKKTSRTAGGVVDTSASAGKAAKLAEGLTGDQAAQHAVKNFEGVVRALHRIKDSGFKSADQVLDLADRTAAAVNKGIVKEGSLHRTDDSEKFPYTKAEHLPLARQQFAQEFAQRLNDPHADPVETAAWVEWRANLTDHLWSDGVGKTAKALAALPLMRAGLPLPQYPDNQTFFQYAGRQRYDPHQGAESYLDANWERFRDFYKTLVPRQATQPTQLGTEEAPGEELLFRTATGAHAPAGYTHARPLVIGGKPFTGGMFIPGDVLAKATDEERAQLHAHDAEATAEAHAGQMTAAEKQHAETAYGVHQKRHGERLHDTVKDKRDTDAELLAEYLKNPHTPHAKEEIPKLQKQLATYDYMLARHKGEQAGKAEQAQRAQATKLELSPEAEAEYQAALRQAGYMDRRGKIREGADLDAVQKLRDEIAQRHQKPEKPVAEPAAPAKITPPPSPESTSHERPVPGRESVPADDAARPAPGQAKDDRRGEPGRPGTAEEPRREATPQAGGGPEGVAGKGEPVKPAAGVAHGL